MHSFTKPDTKNTEIIVITDRSGSMGNLVNDVIGGYNNFLEEQKKIEGQARVTFVQFDHEIEQLYEGKPLSEAPLLTPVTYRPRGSTALLDAIGRTLTTQGERIGKERWANLKVVVILTDGEENASKEYTLEKIRELSSQFETHGYRFVYIGANQDSFKAASNLGLKHVMAANFTADSKGTREAYVNMSSTLSSYRTS